MRIRKFTSDLISMGKDQAQRHPHNHRHYQMRVYLCIYKYRERFRESFRERMIGRSGGEERERERRFIRVLSSLRVCELILQRERKTERREREFN
jgi:hypothetical protein